MCKFAGFDAPGYRTISTAITEWVQAAPDVTNVRWSVEDDGRRVRAQLEMNERARPFVRDSPQNTDTYYSTHMQMTRALSPGKGDEPFGFDRHTCRPQTHLLTFAYSLHSPGAPHKWLVCSRCQRPQRFRRLVVVPPRSASSRRSHTTRSRQVVEVIAKAAGYMG